MKKIIKYIFLFNYKKRRTMNGEFTDNLRSTGMKLDNEKKPTNTKKIKNRVKIKDKSSAKISLKAKAKGNKIDPVIMQNPSKPVKKSRKKKMAKRLKSIKGMSRLDRYAQYDRHTSYNQPFPAIEGFKGPLGD